VFSPYHKLQSCASLRSCIEGLIQSKSISDEAKKGHKSYHYALIHKLNCAKHYLTELEQILKNTAPGDFYSNKNDFIFKVNLYIDGFFYSCGSALDILAREILIYYGIQLPQNVYFNTAEQLLTLNRPTEGIITILNNVSWKNEISNYRNASTHELFIAGQINININVDGETQKTEIIIPLADDPHQYFQDRKYTRNTNVLVYCKDSFKKLLSLINRCYGEINSSARTKNTMPI
jgi:hypothetical protein